MPDGGTEQPHSKRYGQETIQALPPGQLDARKVAAINPFGRRKLPGIVSPQLEAMISISHTKAFEMAISIAELFPLFSPEGEKYWVPSWDYENVMGTAELSEDYVFLTKTHDHRTTDAIWIVKKYDPESHFVQFYKIEPEDKMGVVTVKCTELEAERTKVQVTYKYIALSAIGEMFVSEFSESAYEEFINEWETLLSNYFKSKG